MPDNIACDRRRPFLPSLSWLFGVERRHKPSLSDCYDRNAALDDPTTRKALADLPPHLLQDVGVVDTRSDMAATSPQEGDALRRFLW
ncbi:hypothetical protein JWJ88_19925 [Paracoccus methylovorus]|uniref:DUF1127 domain-containing protein n=1 Tax=Paracoccus methylovorus TaxID=2812658 RepID=A0ABX7JM46_9RHOB|nr:MULTISPECIES: hypothetical protein [Paracoccus]QRZ15195.1 hypothetical protein JWJ88_19925 [Paracoccus methylovorus]